jgi:hypothetical protein
VSHESSLSTPRWNLGRAPLRCAETVDCNMRPAIHGRAVEEGGYSAQMGREGSGTNCRAAHPAAERRLIHVIRGGIGTPRVSGRFSLNPSHLCAPSLGIRDIPERTDRVVGSPTDKGSDAMVIARFIVRSHPLRAAMTYDTVRNIFSCKELRCPHQR